MKLFTTLCFNLLLCACMIVEDFSEYWDSASTDPCIERIVEKHYAESFDKQTPPKAARYTSLQGDSYILMLKKNETDEGGHLYRFDLQGNLFIGYKPNPAAFSQFKNTYPDAPAQVKKDKISIDTLDASTLDFIAQIAQDDAYWKSDVKAMYNSRRNSLCSLHMPELEKEEE